MTSGSDCRSFSELSAGHLATEKLIARGIPTGQFSLECLPPVEVSGVAGSHIASVIFYLEATTRIHEKLTCIQVKCSAVCEG